MKRAPKKELTAVGLRNGLITIVLLLFAAGGGGFYLAYGGLSDYAQEVADTIAQAESSKQTASSLATLKIALLQQQDIANLANNLYAPTSTWQAQAIKDIGVYAALSGISISDYKIGQPAATDPGTTPPTTLVPASNTTQQLTIQLTAPVSYRGLLNFVTNVQNNVPKMQVLGLDLSRSTNAETVGISSITIGVYTR